MIPTQGGHPSVGNSAGGGSVVCEFEPDGSSGVKFGASAGSGLRGDDGALSVGTLCGGRFDLDILPLV